MSTRFKLIFLVLLTGLGGASSLLVNDMMLRPVREIQEESKLLNQLHFSMMDYVGQVNRLNSESFRDQLARVEDSKVKMDGAFDEVAGMTVLPDLNRSIADSLETIGLFRGIMDKAHNSMQSRAANTVSAADAINGEGKPFTITMLLLVDADGDRELAGNARDAAFFLDSSISVLNNTAGLTITNLETQNRIIDGEVVRYQKRAQRVILIVAALVIIVPLAIAVIIANLLANRIRRIEIGISRMKEGDLADRIDSRSSDDLGRLGRNVNEFTDELGRSVIRIKEASSRNLSIKDKLLSSVEKVKEATASVSGSAHSITGEIEGLDRTVHSTSDAVGVLESRLTTLEEVIQEQMAMVEETSASVTQMIASISNVSDITTRKKDSLGRLVQISDEGGTRLSATNDVIRRVHDSIEEIRSTATLIDDIASRTNLLAMNAAIEAAHAGDAGRGFAVVADEIRKLAEATASNSKHIDGVMAAVIGNIEEAVETGQTTGGVFDQIDNEVTATTASFDEIAGSMEELKSGGTQILDAMGRLNDISGQVKDDGVAMGEAAGANRSAMTEVLRIAEAAAGRVAEISTALDGLESEMSSVLSLSEQADNVSQVLEKEVSVYQVKAEENEETPETGDTLNDPSEEPATEIS